MIFLYFAEKLVELQLLIKIILLKQIGTLIRQIKLLQLKKHLLKKKNCKLQVILYKQLIIYSK